MPSPTPLALRVSPVKTELPAGWLHATEHVTLTNAGTQPITVTTAPITVHQAAQGCGVGGSNGWLSISDRTLQLAPGQSRTVTVTIDAPHTAIGSTDLAAVFTAHGTESVNGSNVAVEGAVGSQFIITAKGSQVHAPICVTTHLAHRAAALPHPGGSSPVDGLAGIAVIVAITGAATAVGIRTWRKRRRSPRRRRAAHAAR